MRLVCLSDTHGRHGRFEVPDGDVLVHAGDGTRRGTRDEVASFADWLATLPHRHKLVIAGNHDALFQRDPAAARALVAAAGATYLEDSGVTIDGVRFWGSPWQPWFLGMAFNLRRGAPLRARWDLVPAHTDVLVTHGPPYGVRDRVTKPAGRLLALLFGQGAHAGCRDLAAAVERLQPQVHVFGHIHEGYGVETRGGTTYANAATCDVRYRPVNPPLVIDVAVRTSR